MTPLKAKIVGLGLAGIIMPLLFLLLSPLIVYFAWTEQLLWNWFAAGYLHLQPIALLPAIGIALLISLFATDRRVIKGQEILNGKTIAANLSAHTFAVIVGYFLHRYIAQ